MLPYCAKGNYMESVKIAVKVGKQSHINMRNSKLYRAVSMDELEILVSKYNDIHVVVIEGILKIEQQQLKQFISNYTKIGDNHVLFYIPDSEETVTSGVADELEYEILMSKQALEDAVERLTGVNVGTSIKWVDDTEKEENRTEEKEDVSEEHPEKEDDNNECVVKEEAETTEQTDDYKQDTSALEVENEKLRLKVDELNNQLGSVAVTIESRNKEKKELENTVEELRQQIDRLEENEKNNSDKEIAVDKEKELLNKEIADLKKQLEEKSNEVESLTDISSENESEVDRLKEEVGNLKLELDELVNKVNDLNAQVARKEEELKDKDNKIREKDEALSRTEHELKEKIDKNKELLDKLKEANESKDKEISERESAKDKELKQAIDKKDNEIREARQALEAREAQIKNLTENIRVTSEEIENKNNVISKLNEEISELRNNETSLNSEITKLKENLANNPEVVRLKLELENKGMALEATEAKLAVSENRLKETLAQVGDISAVASIRENNRTLSDINQNLKAKIAEIESQKATLQADNQRLNNSVNSLKESENQLRKSLDAVDKGSMTEELTVGMIKYSSKAQVVNVFGHGSHGITTTAMSIAAVIGQNNKVVVIDMDLATPNLDQWAGKSPYTASVSNIDKSLRTGLGVLISKGYNAFMGASGIVKTMNINHAVTVDYVNGLYGKVTSLQIASADYESMLNHLGNEYDYIVIDSGKIGESELHDSLINSICCIASSNVYCVNGISPVQVNSAVVKLGNSGIDRSRVRAFVNRCTNSGISEVVKKLLSGMQISTMPADNNLIFKAGGYFTENRLTREKFTDIVKEVLL